MTKIHLLTATPMGILIVYRNSLWCSELSARMARCLGRSSITSGGLQLIIPKFRTDSSVFGKIKHYYTPQAAEEAGKQWVGRWK